MAKNRTTQEPELVKVPNLIINELTVIAPNRNSKDIATLKDAVIFAENVYYPNRVQLYDLYHDVLSMDGYLKGIVQKRIDNVLNKSLKFIDKSGKVNDDLTKFISGAQGRFLITKIMESIIWGISGVEFIIGDKPKIVEIPRKHIKPEKGIITKQQYGVSKEDNFVIDDMPFVWVIGEKNDFGLLLSCSMYAIYKRGTFGDYAQYVEIFGQPVTIVKYDAYDTKTKQELKQILDNSGSSLRMMLPKQADFEMMDGKTNNGDGQLQLGLIKACDDVMGICILGNTETTSSSKSSGFAQAKEHSHQQNEILKSDLVFVVNNLNDEKCLTILKSYGFVIDGEFIYDKELDLAELKLRMEVDTVVSSKVPFGDDYWYETYGVAKPDNYDELKAKMEQEEEEEEPEPNPDDEKTKEPKDAKTKLLETKKKTVKDLVFKRLADFFDQARQ